MILASLRIAPAASSSIHASDDAAAVDLEELMDKMNRATPDEMWPDKSEFEFRTTRAISLTDERSRNDWSLF